MTRTTSFRNKPDATFRVIPANSRNTMSQRETNNSQQASHDSLGPAQRFAQPPAVGHRTATAPLGSRGTSTSTSRDAAHHAALKNNTRSANTITSHPKNNYGYNYSSPTSHMAAAVAGIELDVDENTRNRIVQDPHNPFRVPAHARIPKHHINVDKLEGNFRELGPITRYAVDYGHSAEARLAETTEHGTRAEWKAGPGQPKW